MVVLIDPSTPTKAGRGLSARRRDPRGRRGAGRQEDDIVRAQDSESTMMIEARNGSAAVTNIPTPEFSPTEVMAFLAKVDEKLTEVRDLLVEQRTVKEHYSTAEVAKIVGKEEFTVREWCRKRRINAIKKSSGRGVHMGWAIPRDELLRYQREGLLPDRRP